MPQDTRTLRSLRSAAIMPDQSSRMTALSGRVATQARNQAGGSIRFPDAASRMRYIQGTISTQQRQAALPPAPTAPGAPTAVVATRRNQQASISFAAPADNGGVPIIDYTIYATPGNASATASASPITVTGLTNGTAYTFRVKARNALGTSPFSAPSAAVIPATIPQPPRIGQITPTNTTLSVAFTAGDNGGADITNYLYSVDGGSTYTPCSPPDITSPIDITGLASGTQYQVALKAVNDISSSDASDILPAMTTSPLRAPYAPTNLQALTINPTSVIISFTAGANGGSPITNYEYLASVQGGWNTDTYTALTPADTASPITITGLTASTPYDIRIRAVNSQGSGDESDILSISTSVAPPPPTPTARYALPADSAAYIYFDTGADNGTTITNYEYSIDDGSFTAVSPADTTSPIKVPGLTNGTTYSIRIRSSSGTDTSSPSDALSVVPAAAIARTAALEYDPSQTASYSGSGTTIANIGSAGTVSGTFNGAVTYNASVKGGVLDFPNANGQSAKFISFPSYDFGNYITIAAWVYPREKHSINGLLTNAVANVSPAGFKFQWNWWNFPPTSSSKNLTFQAGNGTQGGDVSSPANTIVLDKWQHFTYVFDKLNQRTIFFLNGLPTTVSSSISTVANIKTTGAFNIGAYIGGSYTMNAQLGSIKVYSEILTASDIQTEYSATRARFHTPEKPTGISATVFPGVAGFSNVQISFTPGSDSGFAISDYEYSLNNGVIFTNTGYTSSPITIQASSGTYQLRIRAVNEAGPGLMSDAYELVVGLQGPPPG